MNQHVKPTKTIDTLVDDIYTLFDRKDFTFDPDNTQRFGQRLANHIGHRISEFRGAPSLRLSNLGTACSTKLWFSLNTPEEAEPLSPQTRFKFLYGDILEELLLFLAEEAGHTVEGQQDEVIVNGVKGHRDAIIDGRLVDVKSASTFSFRKFKEGGLKEDDPFGYIDQLNAYLHGSSDDVLVKERDVASFLVVDKTLGNICLDTHAANGVDYSSKVDETRAMLAKDAPPPRHYEDEPEGKSGNRKLGVACSYCPFKHKCWPGLRTFLYSSGPVFLTEVIKLPRVTEVNAEGKIVEQF